MSEPDDELSELLTAARVDVDGGRATFHSTLMADNLAKRARGRRWRKIGAGLAAIAIAVPTTAAGTHLLGVRTGIFGDPARDTEVVDHSEMLNACAPGYPKIVKQHQPDGPLPSGTNWDAATTDLVAEAAKPSFCAENPQGSLQPETSIDAGYMFWAQASWFCTGADAIHAGDRSGWIEASSQLQHIVDSDLMAKVDGGGVRAHDAKMAAAIGHGKVPFDPNIDCSKVDR